MKRIYFLILLLGAMPILGSNSSLEAADDLMTAARISKFRDKIRAPAFELEDPKGNRLRLEDFRGKVVLLSFWATW